MLELVFAPCSPIAGGSVNWIAKPDAEIVASTMVELERLFPNEIAADGSKVRAWALFLPPLPSLLFFFSFQNRGLRFGEAIHKMEQILDLEKQRKGAERVSYGERAPFRPEAPAAALSA